MGKINKGILLTFFIIAILLMTACSKSTNEGNQEENSNEEVENGSDSTNIETMEFFDVIVFSVREKEQDLGNFEVDLRDIEREFELDDGTRIVFDRFYPDFVFEDNEPHSKSDYPVNPAFIFTISKDDHAETKFISIGEDISAEEESVFSLEIVDFIMEEYYIQK